MKMAAFGGNTKLKGHDPIRYMWLQEQENFLQMPLTVQTPTMSDQQRAASGVALEWCNMSILSMMCNNTSKGILNSLQFVLIET